jgi:GTP-binding protein Era
MMSEVRGAVEGCNLVLMMVDALAPFGRADLAVLDLVKKSGAPAFLLLNKIDLLRSDRSKLLPLIDRATKLHQFKEVLPLSARKREGLELLLSKMVAALPQGPRYFPDDQITDQPMRFMVSEVVREQVLLKTNQEVPHAVSVVIEQFEEGVKLSRIAAAIYCEREGQKRILVGKGGQMLKGIGTAARLSIEQMLGMKVFLQLFVKVKSDWRDSREFVDQLDWRRQLAELVGSSGTSSGSTRRA